MATTFGDVLVDRNSDILSEVLAPSVAQIAGTSDPVWRGTVLRNARVTNPEIGRDLKFWHQWMGGLSGVGEDGYIKDHFTLYGDDTQTAGNFAKFTNTQTMPDPRTGYIPTPQRMSAELSTMNFALPLSVGLLNMEVTPGLVDPILPKVFDGWAGLIARRLCQNWYQDPENNNRLGTIAAGSIEWDDTARTMSFTLTEETYARFERGLPVDLFTPNAGDSDGSGASGGSPTLVRTNELSGSRIPMLVQSVDYATGKVTLVQAALTESGASVTFTTDFRTKDLSGGGNANATAAYFNGASQVGDGTEFVTLANVAKTTDGSADATQSPMYGYSHFLKYGGSTNADKRILGSQADSTYYLDVEEWPEHKTLRFDNVGVLTERVLNRKLDAVSRWRMQTQNSIDTMIVSDGIITAIFENDASRELVLRDGPANMRQGMGGEYSYVHEGETYTMTKSYWLQKNRVLGLRMQGNWEFRTLASAQGTQSHSNTGGIGGEINKLPFENFVTTITGGAMKMWPLASSANIPTELSGLYVTLKGNMWPAQQFAGFILDGVTESKDFTTT